MVPATLISGFIARSGSVFEGIAHGVANNGGCVRIGTFAA